MEENISSLRSYTYGGAGTPRYGQKAAHDNENTARIILHPGWNDILIKMMARQHCGFKYSITEIGGGPFPPLGIKP